MQITHAIAYYPTFLSAIYTVDYGYGMSRHTKTRGLLSGCFDSCKKS